MAKEQRKPTVYVETSIFSVLVARPSADVVIAGRQETTRRWWREDREKFALVTSELVALEAKRGDSEMARQRLEHIGAIEWLPVLGEIKKLGTSIIDRGHLPPKAAVDAQHVAMCAVHRIEYLTTWNCRHLANVQIYQRLSRFLIEIGYNPPVLCTPSGLPGVSP